MFKMSAEGEAFVKKEVARYEDRKSAIIPSLFRVQQENGGWVSPECVKYLAGVMDIPEIWIEEVLSFYTMFNKRPVGQFHVQVCCNVSCAMNGGRELLQHLCSTFKVDRETVTPDGRYSFTQAECLGACDKAPMLQVNADPYLEGLTNESAVAMLKGLKA